MAVVTGAFRKFVEKNDIPVQKELLCAIPSECPVGLCVGVWLGSHGSLVVSMRAYDDWSLGNKVITMWLW